jgi:hypothetical protein
MEVVDRRHAPAALPPPPPPERNSVPIVQEAGWAPGPVWTGAGNITLTGIRSSDRFARRLYWLDANPTL